MSFGSNSFLNAVNRLEREAKKSKYFDSVTIYTEETIKKILNANKNDQIFMQENSKGYGFWIWKPIIIWEMLKKIKKDDLLVYLDSGCEINFKSTKAREKYSKYILMTKKNNSLFFDNGQKIIRWTKRMLLEELKVTEEVSASNQIQAGCFFLKKNYDNINLIDRWLYYCRLDNYRLLDETSGELSEHKEFIQHRHDQAILSLLVSSKVKILKDETTPELDKIFGTANLPILASRNTARFPLYKSGVFAFFHRLLRKTLVILLNVKTLSKQYL